MADESDPLEGLIRTTERAVKVIGQEKADPLEGLVRGEPSELGPMQHPPGYVPEIAEAGRRLTSKEMSEMLLQGALASAAQGAGSELGANLSPAHPLIAGTVGSFAGGTAGDLFWDALAGRAPRPGKSAVVGGAGAAVEGATGALGVMGARGGAVSKRAVAGTLQQGPMKSTIQALRGKGVTLGRSGEMFGGIKEGADVRMAEQAAEASTQALSRTNLSPGRRAAEAKMDAFDNAGNTVDMAPIKAHIDAQIRPNAVPAERQKVNDYLSDLKDRIPDRMSMKEYDLFIRDLTDPVRGQIGNIESSAGVAIQKGIASFMRGHRDRVVLPGAAKDFAAASQYLGDVQGLRDRLVNQVGELKPGAENLWLKSLRTTRIREAMKRYDKATGDDLFVRASKLARKQQWTPEDGKTASGWLEALAGWIGRASVMLGRGAGKVAIAASRPAGHATSAGVQQMFESAMGQGGPPVERTVPYPWEEKPEP